jgi:hypothetical protein
LRLGLVRLLRFDDRWVESALASVDFSRDRNVTAGVAVDVPKALPEELT